MTTTTTNLPRKNMKKKKNADAQMARHSLGAVPWDRSPLWRTFWLEGLELWAGRWSLALWFFWCWRKQDIAHSCAVSGLHQRHLTPTHISPFWRGSFQTLGIVLSGLTEMLRFEKLICSCSHQPQIYTGNTQHSSKLDFLTLDQH